MTAAAVTDRARTKAFPATAQVAAQQGEYLAKRLNGLARHSDGATDAPFNYRHLGQLAYIGGEQAAVDMGGGHNISGWGTGDAPQHNDKSPINAAAICTRQLHIARLHTSSQSQTHSLGAATPCFSIGAYWLWKGTQAA